MKSNLNNRTTQPIKLFLLTFLCIIISNFTIAQNINDPYLDVDGKNFAAYPTGVTNAGVGGNLGKYQGEYQFHLPSDHPWSQSSDYGRKLYVRVKTECLSFPANTQVSRSSQRSKRPNIGPK